ncbi:anaphase-promoting complex subunit 10-like [Corticium candelabrum]|uniref:anaphase-promoting complex subunit 10-like n=1 Tax=Corticium candelabrum TaxID=121492 RepID=UPI002E273CAB|nr:anaphase-promoting complex subunit 10-like [Corticium candelabrum]
MDFHDVEEEERYGAKLNEIGDEAVWSVSSCKVGFGVQQLRDGNLDSYWQSDGTQPHLIDIQFPRKTAIQELGVYTDFRIDESYTPSKISVRAGSHYHDLEEVTVVTLTEPVGWTTILLTNKHNQLCRAFHVQVAILANHQNGRDTHLRQIRVYTSPNDLSLEGFPPFTSQEFKMWSSVR